MGKNYFEIQKLRKLAGKMQRDASKLEDIADTLDVLEEVNYHKDELAQARKDAKALFASLGVQD